jgi:hypothetical protein
LATIAHALIHFPASSRGRPRGIRTHVIGVRVAERLAYQTSSTASRAMRKSYGDREATGFVRTISARRSFFACSNMNLFTHVTKKCNTRKTL